MNAPLDMVLAEFRTRLAGLYGNRLDRVILFGSQARGDADPESDIDVMLVFRDAVSWQLEKGRLMPLAAELSLKYDTVIMPFVTDQQTYAKSSFSLYENVRREGVTV